MAMKIMFLLLAVSSWVSSYVMAHDHEGFHITVPPGTPKYSGGPALPPEAHVEDHHHLAYIPRIAAMHSEVKLRRLYVKPGPVDDCQIICKRKCQQEKYQGPQSCLQNCYNEQC